jgi:tetratricopeptide (TPR) repeat protein
MRRIAALVAVGTTLALVRNLAGGGAVVALAGALAGAWLGGRVLLPRLAHRAFRGGRYRLAGALYTLAVVRFDAAARAAARVSRAACRVAREDWEGGLGALARIDEAGLDDPVRAAALNNRAYALVRSGSDSAAALTLADAAIALRPDVPGFRHTRAIALLASGRADDAIRELDEVWRRGDERAREPLLEAERCFDLGLAWERRGDVGHAADYYDRARRAAPATPWGARAAARLPAGIHAAERLAELDRDG